MATNSPNLIPLPSARPESGVVYPANDSQIASAMARAQGNLLRQQKPDGHWCGELFVDSTLCSDYVLYLHWLGEVDREIQDRCGQEVLALAYPHGIRAHGDYSDQTRSAAAAAGYRAAFISEIGRNRSTDDPYRQRRIEPKCSDSRRLLLSKLLGAYDWVGLAQAAFHRVFPPDSPPSTPGCAPPTTRSAS